MTGDGLAEACEGYPHGTKSSAIGAAMHHGAGEVFECVEGHWHWRYESAIAARDIADTAARITQLESQLAAARAALKACADVRAARAAEAADST